MKRTSIVLDPELEISLKLEAMRQRRPSSELVREALRAYLAERQQAPDLGWIGGLESATAGDVAERAEDELADLGEGSRGAGG
jgi:predicted transcriptional regulator